MTLRAERIDTACVPRLAPHARLRWDEAREGWVLLGPERVILLDEIGSAILQRCDGTRALSEVIELLAEDFEADPEVVEEDVQDFLCELGQKGLLRL